MAARLHTRLIDAPLSVADAHAFVADPAAGATVVFTGNVRNHSVGGCGGTPPVPVRAVAGLEYEAYAGQADRQLVVLAEQVARKWPEALAVWMEHRVGSLRIGECSVVVAVSAPHRAEAFEAARYGIDELKATVAIWKREQWADGSAHWPGTDC
ncbi:MAG: molybdenum cofactor biosynthesis protein MoaE [Egibacteraceae bacterium]